jgi:hypothetical protein
MSEFAGRVQQGLKQTSTDFALLALKLASGSVIGFTLALVVQEILGQPSEMTLAFIFSFLITVGVFWRLTRSWGLSAVLVFDLIAILTGLLLRLYVMIAPNA